MYLEDLPDSCPPATANEPNGLIVYRLVKAADPSITDFYSHCKLGLPKPPTVNACRWSSCSVFASLDVIKNMMKLPKFKNHSAVTLTLTNAAGRVHEGENSHYDWWVYASFDPIAVSAPA